MKRKPRRLFLLLLLPTLGVGAVVLLLMLYRVPTRVQFRGTTHRLRFSVSGEEPVDVLNSLDFRSIAIQKFDHFQASPDSIAIADTQEFAVRKDIPDGSWRRISAVSPIDITGQDPGLLPSIAIESSRQEIESAGTLDRVWVRPGTEVTLEKTNTQMPALSLKLDGQPAIAVLSFPNSFNLFGDHASIGGISDRLLGGESFALRIHLPSSRPEAEVTGKGPLLALFLNLPTREHPRVFSRNGIPVTAIDFTQQGPQGNVESSLIGTGEIVFPDYPKMQRIEIPARQFVVLQNLKRFRIEQIELNPETNKIDLTVGGVAGIVRAGPPGFARDFRISYFDMLWQNPRLLVLFSIAAWVLPTTLAGFRLYKELAK